MKSPSRLISATVIACSLLALGTSSCAKKDRAAASSTAHEAVADSKAAISNAWDDVKAFSFEKRTDFHNSAKALTSKMDSEISELRTNYSEAKASASRKLAMEELKSSEIDYRTKLNALGNATAATWDSAKQNVILAWDKTQAAYYKAKAD